MKLHILIFLIILSFQALSQETKFLIGCIKDQQNFELIQNAHIINLKNKKGTISNQQGIFMIPIEEGDYLKISYLGYNSLYFKVNHHSSDTLNLFIQKKAFVLEEVEVYPWTKEEFKFKFINLEVNQDSIDYLRNKIIVPKEDLVAALKQAQTQKMRENNPNMIVGVSMPAFANYKTKKDKQIVELEALKKWVKKETEYRKLVQNITNYKDEELNRFIKFCNFSKSYISTARSYYLGIEIQKKYKAFESLKSSKVN